MARKAPPISVKDLTAALAIGKEQGKQESLVAEKRPDSPVKKPGGPPWPGYPNPMPPGKDWPVELAINANNIRRTGTPPLVNDNDYGPGSDKWPQTPGRDWQISHGEHFGDRGEIIQDPGFGIDPGGNPIRLPHMEQTPEEQERNKGLHDWKYHDGEEPGTFDKVLEVASELNPNQLKILKEIPSNINKLAPAEKLKIMKDITGRVMKAELPANNIRRLKDTGHKTDYTGGFRLGDDGKLHPVMGIKKADASNNIRRLNESGHQTVFDPITGQLKIVKTIQCIVAT